MQHPHPIQRLYIPGNNPGKNIIHSILENMASLPVRMGLGEIHFNKYLRSVSYLMWPLDAFSLMAGC